MGSMSARQGHAQREWMHIGLIDTKGCHAHYSD